MKDDLFYCIDTSNDIMSFIFNDDKQAIEGMIVPHLCHKQINDIQINYECKYIFARNEYNIYCYEIKYGVMKEYICQEKIIHMCCGNSHSILLTQSGKVYEYKWNDDERKKSKQYIDFKFEFQLKSFNNSSIQNEKIVSISCGIWHSLALTEDGRVFGWGSNNFGQLGIDVRHSSEPIIDLKIQKISCGSFHSLLLSCDGDIYAFGRNWAGVVGNGTRKEQRFPIKLEHNKKFIDIASHPYYHISMSQSIDGIYYVWGHFEGKTVLSPQSTKYQSFEHILRVDGTIGNMKTFDKLVEFEDSFTRNGFYSKHFQEIKELGNGSFGFVFKIKRREGSNYYRRRDDEYSAIKRIEFTSIDTNDEMRKYRFREFFNYKKITRDCSDNENLVQHFDAWFEEELVISSQTRICLYIQMELCHKTLEDVVNEFDKESRQKTNETLTTVGYYIAS
jgi:hypothetical protein